MDGVALDTLRLQTSFPVAASYAMTLSVPLVTSSVRLPTFTSTGVDQLIDTGRVAFHSSFPVVLSYATTADVFSSWSRWMMTVLSKRTGDVPVPSPSVWNFSTTFHASLPLKS